MKKLSFYLITIVLLLILVISNISYVNAASVNSFLTSKDNLSNYSMNPGETILVSKSPIGEAGNNSSNFPSISYDGKLIAFDSSSDNLISDDHNNVSDIFVYNLETDIISRESRSYDGYRESGKSWFPKITENGENVAFSSYASNLVLNDTNNEEDTFVRNLSTGENFLGSTTPTGEQLYQESGFYDISNDGQFLLFTSSQILFPEAGISLDNIYLNDRTSDEIELISVSSSGITGNGYYWGGALSDDGMIVSFSSESNNLVLDDNNLLTDIFVRDRLTGETKRVSIATDGTESDGSSHSPTMSTDGRFIAFQSSASNLVVNDLNKSLDIFVHDRLTGETTRVSLNSEGIEGNGDSSQPSISSNGRYIAFSSYATNLVLNDTNLTRDVFVHDRETGKTIRASVASDGSEADRYSSIPSISGDGKYVVFESLASNLSQNDTNGLRDIYLHKISWEEVPPQPTPDKPNWLLMFYMAGDNNLDGAIRYEISKIRSYSRLNPNVEIAIFYDSTELDTSYRFYSSYGDLEYIAKGNLNSGDGQNLIDFINWAKLKSSASRQALIISDHGHGLRGLSYDYREIQYSPNETHDNINAKELRDALISSGPVDVFYASACMMGNIEFMWELRGLTDYYVASESVMWLPVDFDFIEKITQETNAENLAENMAKSYFNRKNSKDTPSTISAVNMTFLQNVVEKTQNLGGAIRQSSPETKAGVWSILTESNLQRFDERLPRGIDTKDRLADLFHFASLVNNYPELSPTATALLDLESDFVIFDRGWPGIRYDNNISLDHTYARGVSVTLPTNSISFYIGDWLDFADGADWIFTDSSEETQNRYDTFQWGPMISDLIAINNPEGADDPYPPELVEPGIKYDIYLPIITH